MKRRRLKKIDKLATRKIIWQLVNEAIPESRDERDSLYVKTGNLLINIMGASAPKSDSRTGFGNYRKLKKTRWY